MKYQNILEEETKNKVTQDFFSNFDCTKILGKIDFAVKVKRPASAIKFEDEYLLWAEAKQKTTDIIAMLTQLVLTIGKAKTFNEILPPPFLGCYDNEKIAFMPYHKIHDIFYQNDFNWNVTSSNTETKEFKQVYNQIKKVVEGEFPWSEKYKEVYKFDFEKDEKELRKFIKDNFIARQTETIKLQIDKNNFIIIYNKWLETVKPTIEVNWEAAKKVNIIDGDFYLADLLSANNETIKEKLFVLLKSNVYRYNKQTDALGEIFREAYFSDNQRAHAQFWEKYNRPPKEDYWDYIIERRDLLVPQDVRERKGSFFTPPQWVELSQRYLADVFGEDWQDEYYIWDCCAGTGNLLAGLTNKYNIWASTLDQQDVDVMYDRINNGANLLQDHIFKFDFLNDSFDKLPEGLQKIINNPKLRKQLIIYINPPYAETNAKKGTEKGENIGKIGVNLTKQREKYDIFLGKGKRELYAQFVVRIFNEITDCNIAIFSKLKILNAPFYENFRNKFIAKLKKLFVVPANTFDNVNGQFPIGFQIWNTSIKEKFKHINADVYDKNGNFIGKKGFYSYENKKYINDWIIENRYKKETDIIGKIFCVGSDFQHQNYCRLNSQNIPKQAGFTIIDVCLKNLIECCVYFAVRKVISADWLNDRDQFLFPNKNWEKDIEFHNDCLTYTIFNNNISSKNGINHWIPFKESEVNAHIEFESHIMISFLSGKKIQNAYMDLFSHLEESKKHSKLNWKEGQKREFSAEAQAVFDAGKEVWKYYHKQSKVNVNASYYDIRAYFKEFKKDKQGKERMNNKSTDPEFNTLEKNLSQALNILAKKIEPKVYEYEFLKA